MARKLAPGEQVRVRTRAHPRLLRGPVLRLLLVATLTGYLHGLLARPDLPPVVADARHWLTLLVWVLSAVLVLVGTVRPLWRWFTRTTVLTTQRLMQQAGRGARRQRAAHLVDVAALEARQRRAQRRAGSGDLMVTLLDGTRWVFAEMPEVTRLRDLTWREVNEQRRQTQLAPGQWGSALPQGGHPQYGGQGTTTPAPALRGGPVAGPYGAGEETTWQSTR